MSCCNN